MPRARSRARIAWAAAAAITASLLSAPHASAITNAELLSDGDGRIRTVPRIRIGDDGERNCSAVLIDAWWILTAASCFADDPANPGSVLPGPPKKRTIITAGPLDNRGTPAGSGPMSSRTQVVELIPRADRDLVLGRLDFPNWNTTNHPTKFATTAPRPGETLQMIGHGRTATEWAPRTKRIADTSVVSVAGTGINVAGESSICKGDAGGPTYRVVNGQPELVAIHGASWQRGCLEVTETRNGAVEARVDDINGWIRQHIPNLTIDCASSATAYATRAGNVWLRHNYSQAEGGRTWWAEPATPIGTGWLGVNRAGPSGVLWDVHRKSGAGDPFNDGDLRLSRYQNGAWTGGAKVGDGWQRYLDPAHRNKITVDAEGRIYVINAANELRVFVWDDIAKQWADPAGELLDTGWGLYNALIAADDGVLYARTPAGLMFRFHYDHATKQWVQRDKRAGGGWNIYSQIFSPGGDILFGAGSTRNGVPVLRWHRYYPESDAWAPRGTDNLGTVVAEGDDWNAVVSLTAEPDDCRSNR